jgi:hypothetical protein
MAAERLYPPGIRLRSVYNSGADYDGAVSLADEQRCEIHMYGSTSSLAMSRDEALRLAAWIMATFGEPP